MYSLDPLVASCLGVVNETSEVSDEGVTDLLSSMIFWAYALIFPLSLLHETNHDSKVPMEKSNFVTLSCMY